MLMGKNGWYVFSNECCIAIKMIEQCLYAKILLHSVEWNKFQKVKCT